MSSELIELFKHNLWANLTILNACEKLTDEQLDTPFVCSYGTIRQTLVHFAGGEELYVHMLLGQPRPPGREEAGFQSFEQLRELLTSTGQKLIEIVENNSIPANYLELAGNQTEDLTGSMVILLAINHATEHRAHINSAFSHLGLPPVEIDGWAYGWTHGLYKVY